MPYLTSQKSGPAHERFYWRAGDSYAEHEGKWKLWVVAKPESGFATFRLTRGGRRTWMSTAKKCGWHSEADRI